MTDANTPRTTRPTSQRMADALRYYLARVGWDETAEAMLDNALAEAAAPTPAEHQDGEPHLYRIACEVCGQRGMVNLSIEPQTAARPDQG